MTFLNPAVLFGLLAASIPVLIHLLNLRKLKKIEFSTLAFLKELQKSRIRKVKLKQWILLALRILVILLIVLAFARPALKGVAIGGTTSAAKTTAVFILDDTFSMSVIDADGSYLNQAKESLQQLLRNLQEGDETALILVSESKNEVKPGVNTGGLSERIPDINPSYTSNTLHEAVTKASNVLAGSKNFNKEIYIFSDFQKSRISEKGSVSDLSQLLDEKVKMYLFNYSGKEIYNLGIDDIKVETQIFEKNKPVAFNITISNYSSVRVDNAVLSLFVNNERMAQQSISLDGKESAVVPMEAVIMKSGYVEVFAEIEDDEIMQDNRRYTVLYIPEKIPVLLFYDDEKDISYIELALMSSGNEGTLNILKRNFNQLASVNLNRYEVLIAVGGQENAVYEKLKDFTVSGGLFLLPGSRTSPEGFQNILNTFGLQIVKGSFGKPGSRDNTVNFDKIEFNHPVFSNLFSDNAKKNIESPDIHHHLRITPGGDGVSIISLMNGSSFLSEYKKGNGKILVCSTSPDLSWSDFPLKGIFPPLINKSVYYLASRTEDRENILAGDALSINIAGKSISQIKIEKPDSIRDFINPEDFSGSGFLSYNNTDRTGIFRIYSGTNILNEVAINHNPLESVAESVTEDEIEEYLSSVNFKGNHFYIKKGENPVEVIQQARYGSELWKIFILAAIITALLEMLVARNVKKELAEV